MMDREKTIYFLENLLSRGALRSRREQYIQKEIVNPPRPDDSFYAKVLTEQGEVAAKKALADWEATYRLREFSDAIEPIAAGMLEVIQKDTEGQHAHLVTYTNEMRFPRIPLIAQQLKTMIFFNPSLPGCGCSQPKGASIFGRDYGSLALHAISLQTGVDSKGDQTFQMGLAMPRRGFPNKVRENEFVYLMINPTGMTDNYGFQPSADIDDYICNSLGLPPRDTNVLPTRRSVDAGGMFSGGSTDSALGFPGAFDYVAGHIGELGPYLIKAAHHLTNKHSH